MPMFLRGAQSLLGVTTPQHTCWGHAMQQTGQQAVVRLHNYCEARLHTGKTSRTALQTVRCTLACAWQLLQECTCHTAHTNNRCPVHAGVHLTVCCAVLLVLPDTYQQSYTREVSSAAV